MEPDSPNNTDAYYTPTQAARVLNKSDRWVRKELAEGRMEGEQDDKGRWHIPARVIDDRRAAVRRAVSDVFRQDAAPGPSDPETIRRILDMLAETMHENQRLQYELGKAHARAEALQAELDAEHSHKT